MDRFFDRLGDLLQSLLGSDSPTRYYDRKDPDMREAIEELDAYLESGAFASEQPRDRDWERWSSRKESASGPETMDQNLKRDYATLEVALGAPLSEVRKSYKRLLHKYHPDRFSDDAGKQTLANEVTQRLNQAFARIEAQHRSG
jgi:DnaJ-domain-containing protein 1